MHVFFQDCSHEKTRIKYFGGGFLAVFFGTGMPQLVAQDHGIVQHIASGGRMGTAQQLTGTVSE